MNILITGAGGFIGSALCSRLASGNNVIGLYHKKKPVSLASIAWEQANLTDLNAVASICEKYPPDVVIHCAGIAHQKIGAVDFAAYMRTNSEATENLAKAAVKSNPDVCFVFLSSVSVYGEDPQINIRRLTQINESQIKESHELSAMSYQQAASGFVGAVGEGSECRPSSDYAFSKLDAEKRLLALFDDGIIHNLTILRLAPVYDREWSFNLDRRVLAPLNMAYIRFGSGLQKMSALARPNLVEFVEFLIRRLHRFSQIDIDKYPQIAQINADENNIKKSHARQNNLSNRRNLWIFNVCDAKPYEFNRIIQVFKNSGIRPNRPVVFVPLPLVRLATCLAGSLFSDKRKWFYSCYDKLASSLVFDNEKMLKTGFRPRHSFETIFDPQITQIDAD